MSISINKQQYTTNYEDRYFLASDDDLEGLKLIKSELHRVFDDPYRVFSMKVDLRIKINQTCDQLYCRNHKTPFVDDIRQISKAINSAEKYLFEKEFNIDIIPSNKEVYRRKCSYSNYIETTLQEYL